MPKNKPTSTNKPLITKFSVEGLFGYKTVTLDFRSPVRIVSAENGTGKTTLLNALYWTLTGQFFRLQAINFHKLSITFGDGKSVSILKSEVALVNLRDVDSSPLMNMRRWGLSRSEITQLMESYLAYGNSDVFKESSVYEKLYHESPWDDDEIVERIHSLVERYVDTEQFSEKKHQITESLGGTEILYLPTYRRIEANLGVEKVKKAETSRDKLIYFGLSDVEETLNEITKSIRASALAAYTKINATFLDNLVATGESENTPKQAIKKIDQEAMKVVLARIGKNDEDPTVRKIDELMRSGAINSERYYHLKYFLSELASSAKSQAAQEEAINRFIAVVNGYWDTSVAEKEFVYDKYAVEVFVRNRISNSRVPLRVLSSGEKQIVSIFSRLNFSDKDSYFVIIDEPELSLSIDWQRLFLPNVAASPKCRALLAITHSPFVFENELDEYASSLRTTNWTSQ